MAASANNFHVARNDVGNQVSLAGKTAIVTGSNTGIGRETALGLARSGARVILACRNLDRAREAAAGIREAYPHADVEPMLLDLKSQASVRTFVQQFKEQKTALHILVNNAGAPLTRTWYTEEGVGGCAQVNFLGPYLLTRLLKEQLVAGAPSRVVTVSSIMHRSTTIKDPRRFLTHFDSGLYSATKFSNVLFTHELQRRWGGEGVDACAVDPGSVASDIWRKSIFSRPPISWVIKGTYAPPWDGAAAVLHAATAPWTQPLEKPMNGGNVGVSNGGADGAQDLLLASGAAKRNDSSRSSSSSRQGVEGQTVGGARVGNRTGGAFFAKGVFAWPIITHATPRMMSLLSPVMLLLSMVDWPIRNMSGHRLLSHVHPVPSSPASYDPVVAKQLWDVAAEYTNLPVEN